MARANWTDLRTRLLSALVMLAVGGVAIWAGGTVFALLVLASSAAMIWELAQLTAPQDPAHRSLALAGAAVAALLAAMVVGGPLGLLCLLIPAIGFVLTPRKLAAPAAAYAAAILIAGITLIFLRGLGGSALLWLVAVIVVSDVMGYFAGRALKGPKFWPAISPKKTWSGTVAGWVGAVLVGACFVIWGGASLGLMVLSPLIAFAGQLGDILESWFKRRVDAKDSSNLIPGHGGFLDRFDALLIAAVVVMLLGLVVDLPLPGKA